MKQKTAVRLAAALVAAALCTPFLYHNAYPIELNQATLPGHIADFYSETPAPAITVYDVVELGNRAWCLMEWGEELGYVSLEKGLNGRYRINHLAWGSGNFREGIVEIDGTKYLLFGGRDITGQIARISVTIDHAPYEFTLPAGTTHFLRYTEVDSRVTDRHIDRGQVRLYNAAGEDIRSHYNLGGGGLQ